MKKRSRDNLTPESPEKQQEDNQKKQKSEMATEEFITRLVNDFRVSVETSLDQIRKTQTDISSNLTIAIDRLLKIETEMVTIKARQDDFEARLNDVQQQLLSRKFRINGLNHVQTGADAFPVVKKIFAIVGVNV